MHDWRNYFTLSDQIRVKLYISSMSLFLINIIMYFHYHVFPLTVL